MCYLSTGCLLAVLAAGNKAQKQQKAYGQQNAAVRTPGGAYCLHHVISERSTKLLQEKTIPFSSFGATGYHKRIAKHDQPQMYILCQILGTLLWMPFALRLSWNLLLFKTGKS